MEFDGFEEKPTMYDVITIYVIWSYLVAYLSESSLAAKYELL